MAIRPSVQTIKKASIIHRSIAMALLWVTATTASAQETGSLIERYKPAQGKEIRGPAAARAALEDYAACQVGKQPARVAKIVTTRIDTPEYEKLMSTFWDSYDECLSSGGIRFRSTTYRGALFQALYNRQYKSKAPLDFTAVKSGYRELYPEDPSAEARGSIALINFGECVTKADPYTVRDLMRSLTGAASEDEAFIRLGPKLNACMPQGNQLTFSKAILKGVLAESIYRLSLAADEGQITK